MIKEQWQEVEGFEGLYSVSNLGRLRSEARKIVRSDGEVRYLQAKVREIKHDSLTLTLSKDKKTYCTYIHRLVAQAFIPNPENHYFVYHIDGNPRNNHASNLMWVSRCNLDLLENQRNSGICR